jgi:hypothetical protein
LRRNLRYVQLVQREQVHVALSATIAMSHAIEMYCWLPQAEAALAQVT